MFVFNIRLLELNLMWNLCRPKPRLFALVIGISKYASIQFNDLPGAVPDANDVVNWLVTDLQVPRHQITLITDEAASRAGVISALEAFCIDDRIHQGDPIFIYYAGHGSGILPPEDWECGGPSRRIQILVPQDCSPEHGIHGVPDHVLGCLIHRISEKKGNNIVGSPGIYSHISAELLSRLSSSTVVTRVLVQGATLSPVFARSNLSHQFNCWIQKINPVLLLWNHIFSLRHAGN